MGINTKSIQSFAVTTAFWLNVAVAAEKKELNELSNKIK